MAQTVLQVSFNELPFRARDSLTQQHVDMVLEAVSAEWQVEQHEDYEGFLTILVSAHDEVGGPTFVISGRVDCFELAELHGDDDLYSRGHFNTIGQATDALAAALSSPIKPFSLRLISDQQGSSGYNGR